jgi:uncharacterized membrane protein YhdT
MGRFCSPCAPPTLRPGHGDFPRWFNRRCLNQNVEKKISRSNFPDHHLAKSWNPNHWTQIIFWKINIVLIMFGYMIHYGLLMFNIHIVSHPTSPSLRHLFPGNAFTRSPSWIEGLPACQEGERTSGEAPQWGEPWCFLTPSIICIINWGL